MVFEKDFISHNWITKFRQLPEFCNPPDSRQHFDRWLTEIGKDADFGKPSMSHGMRTWLREKRKDADFGKPSMSQAEVSRLIQERKSAEMNKLAPDSRQHFDRWAYRKAQVCGIR